MSVLTMPGKPAVHTSNAVSRNIVGIFTRAIGIVRRPLIVPVWAIVIALATLAFGGFLFGRHRPAHHYVAYFGYPLVLDTTTGRACYAFPPKPASPAKVDDPAFPLDGTANQLDTQSTASDQIPLCDQD